MADQFQALTETHTAFIRTQKIFFVGSAARDGRVNVSPKGQDSLAVLGPSEILWLNLTGSGNETAAHLLDVNRLTLMWCAFEGPPLILRVYGSAVAVHPRDDDWQMCAATLPPAAGARQYFRVRVDLVQTSCGYAVPFFDYREDRVALTRWAEKKGEAGVAEYWAEKNQRSLDGYPTGISD
jgi:hypothetical protein